MWLFKWKLLSSTFLWYCLLCCTRVVLTFESLHEILKCDHSNESYGAALSCGTVFIMLYKVVLTFESVDEILKCDHSNESYWAVLFCIAVCCAVLGSSIFLICGCNGPCRPQDIFRLVFVTRSIRNEWPKTLVFVLQESSLPLSLYLQKRELHGGGEGRKVEGGGERQTLAFV